MYTAVIIIFNNMTCIDYICCRKPRKDKIESLGIKVTLPYASIYPSTLDWGFVRDWKNCKTWDQEEYRNGVVPESLQEILDEK